MKMIEGDEIDRLWRDPEIPELRFDRREAALELIGEAFAEARDEPREKRRRPRGHWVARIKKKVLEPILRLKLNEEGPMREDDERRRELHRALKRVACGIGEGADRKRP